MAFLDLMKLEKLTFKAYERADRRRPIGEFKALYNPGSFSQRYEIEYGKQQGLGASSRKLKYIYSTPQELRLKLILDGTGVHDTGDGLFGRSDPVSEQINAFLALAYQMNGAIHEPNFLTVEWGGGRNGALNFSGRLKSVDIVYTTFERDGSPLRAELDIVLLSDQDTTKRSALERKSSPDLTHSRIVKSGDTLPLLTKEIYGSSRYYLRVAQVNGLDDFRNLQPGQEIFFPPLDRSS
jgi:hypothetical protein